MKLHFASIIPIATGVVAVGMGIALLTASGFSPSSGVDNAWMTVSRPSLALRSFTLEIYCL